MIKILHAETTKEGKHLFWVQEGNGIDVKKITCDNLQITFGHPNNACLIAGVGKYKIEPMKTLNTAGTRTIYEPGRRLFDGLKAYRGR